MTWFPAIDAKPIWHICWYWVASNTESLLLLILLLEAYLFSWAWTLMA